MQHDTEDIRQAVHNLKAAVATAPNDRGTMRQPMIDLARLLGYPTHLGALIGRRESRPECYLKVVAKRPLEHRRGTRRLYIDDLLTALAQAQEAATPQNLGGGN